VDALILVDLQNDFMPGGALAVAYGDEVVPIANRLMPRFPLVVATVDWHPADHASFASNQPGHKIGEVIELHGLCQILWPGHCVQGSQGAELHSGLDKTGIHHIVQKGTDSQIDSYSGFFDNGHKKSTGLKEYLRAKGVTRVFILGLATDYCVKFTAVDALAEGFETVLIEDGCRAVNLNADDGVKAIEELKSQGATVRTSTEVETMV
jgi:nicotinamidase/pyrazinamidase